MREFLIHLHKQNESLQRVAEISAFQGKALVGLKELFEKWDKNHSELIKMLRK